MITCQITGNLLWQYIIVALIILGAIAWIIRSIISARKKGKNSCCGCSLADTCAKSKIKNKINEDNKNMER
ncbi:MAG: FeoB-associated Cys-rich membrane protein [Bacteroides sp.]|nr:FeoB-associated Cys-rich membrane protein [Bacteroides sp.]